MSGPAELLLAGARAASQQVGARLIQEPGWTSRGHGTTPTRWKAVMLHDTVTPDTWSQPQLTRLLRDGYTGLPGPICNIQLERNGDAVLIAAGRAYHAGAGSDPLDVGIWSGNLNTVGIEVANGGPLEEWTDVQYEWALAFCSAVGLPALGHKEWAPSRKRDPWSVDMDEFRADLRVWQGDGDKEDPMADYGRELAAIAKATARQTALTERQVRLGRVQAEATVAAERKRLGLAADPESDAVWGSRFEAGSHTLYDAKMALEAKAR